MTEEKLVYMANQIAAFFDSKPPEAAAKGVADHVNAFWDPRMRGKLIALLERDGAGLSETVMRAGASIRAPKEG